MKAENQITKAQFEKLMNRINYIEKLINRLTGQNARLRSENHLLRNANAYYINRMIESNLQLGSSFEINGGYKDKIMDLTNECEQIYSINKK